MSRPALRAFRALAWTAGLFLVAQAVDRATLSPDLPEEWQAAGDPSEVPPDVGTPPIPSFLPQALGWPPHRVLWRAGPAGGWWLELAGQGPERVWIGSGVPPPGFPAPTCLGEGACPAGWHALSREVGGQGVSIVSTIEPHIARKILDGLERSASLPPREIPKE